MRVRLRLFSLFREKAGRGEAVLDLPPGARVRDAVEAVRRTFPALAPHLGAQPVLTSRNLEHVGLDEPLAEDDEVGLFPPVSGG